MPIKEMFMDYDGWFKYNSFKPHSYNDSTVHMLYRDSWIIWILPMIVIIVALIFCWFVLPEFVIAIRKVLGG